MSRMRLIISGSAAVLVAAFFSGCGRPPAASTTPASDTASRTAGGAPKESMNANQERQGAEKVVKTEDQWKAELTPEQYYVLREKGTERAFTGKYWNTKTPGVYRCAGCGEVLFSSQDKFDSGCGWPSFSEKSGKIDEHTDTSFGMVRTEVTCAKCGGHLGHVFEDGPAPTGLRYCINSASIELEPKEKAADEAAKPAAEKGGGS